MFLDLPTLIQISNFKRLSFCHPNFCSISMKNALNPSKTPSIESIILNVIENYATGLVLIALRQVLCECLVALHLPHLNARFVLSSCWSQILPFFGLLEGRRVEGGRTSVASLSPSKQLSLSLSDLVGGEWTVSPITFARSRGKSGYS